MCSTITQFTFPERMASASTLLREAGLVIGVNANTRALRPPNAPLRLLIVCRRVSSSRPDDAGTPLSALLSTCTWCPCEGLRATCVAGWFVPWGVQRLQEQGRQVHWGYDDRTAPPVSHSSSSAHNRDATPRLLCDALLALAAAQRVPVVCFAAADASGSVELGAALGVRTALAVGFKTHDDTHPPSTHDDTHRPSTHDDSRALVRDLAARLAESVYSG